MDLETVMQLKELIGGDVAVVRLALTDLENRFNNFIEENGKKSAQDASEIGEMRGEVKIVSRLMETLVQKINDSGIQIDIDSTKLGDGTKIAGDFTAGDKNE